jgi:predicted secreted protein
MGEDNILFDRDNHRKNITRKLITFFIGMVFIFSVFQNVSAVGRFYTIDDNNSNVTIVSGEKFNVSLLWSGSYCWKLDSYDPSVLKFIDEDFWAFNPGVPGVHLLDNWTFKGNDAGTTMLKFNFLVLGGGNDTIRDTYFLNVTVNAGKSINFSLIIIEMAIIIVVPTAFIIKWMRGGKDNENKSK